MLLFLFLRVPAKKGSVPATFKASTASSYLAPASTQKGHTWRHSAAPVSLPEKEALKNGVVRGKKWKKREF